MNVNFLMAGESLNAADFMAKIHITNKDEIYLKEPALYNKSEHGKILSAHPTPIAIALLEFDSTTVKRVSKIALLKVEESPALKLVIH